MTRNLRSQQSTQGSRMAGARALWRANGMKQEQFGKPIIAIANSFTQFVPGHAHLHDVGQMVKQLIEEQGCFAAEFNSIAIDDGIAMGHAGMLYSLPSRELIADSLEYMLNAHCADALVCISNCDKITPGMLLATMRLNIPTIFVSGGPMEAGKLGSKSIDLVDAIVMGADDSISPELLDEVEQSACTTCGSCSGMFTANSMNCLVEALGLGLVGNGSVLATHVQRHDLFKQAAQQIVRLATDYYEHKNEQVLPRNIANLAAFKNAMTLDIAMGGSTNTILHLLAAANTAELAFTMNDIDELSRKVPNLCKVAPSSSFHMEDVHRAGGIMNIMAELRRLKLIDDSCYRVEGKSLGTIIDEFDLLSPTCSSRTQKFYKAAPGGGFNLKMASQNSYYKELDTDRENGCIRSGKHAYSKEGGLAILFGNIAQNGCVVKTAGVDASIMRFSGRARIFDSQEAACDSILTSKIKAGDVLIIRYEGPKGGPGMQEMLYPTSYLKTVKLDKDCALLTDGRFSGGTSGLSIGHVSPEAAAGGAIALVQDNDEIIIDIRARSINVKLSALELEQRRAAELSRGKKAFSPERERYVSQALKAYALLARSADLGAIRMLPEDS